MTFEHGIRRIVLAGSIAVAGIAGWLAHVDLTSATTPPPDHFCADLAAARQAPLPADVDRSKIADPALRTEYEAMPRESGIEHDTRKLAWYYEQHRRYDKPLPVTEAEFLQTYRQQHRDASDAMAADQWRVIQRHPGIVAAWDDAERYVAAWRDACPAWWATVRRAMTVIGWSLGAGAAVWALFFFLRWIVMGFRGAA